MRNREPNKYKKECLERHQPGESVGALFISREAIQKLKNR
jgi:hypothetical protein